MFVETKREGEIVEAVPSLQGFISWLETKDPNQTYDFMDCRGNCLVGQYMTAIGIGWDDGWNGSKAPFYGSVSYGAVLKYEPCLSDVAYQKPHTFGAALVRAQALVGKNA